MGKGYVIYNLRSGHKNSLDDVLVLNAVMNDTLKYIDVKEVKNYKVFLSGLTKDDYIILCGGDGTLNRFVNDTAGIDYDCEILYYPIGTGNDFAADLGEHKWCNPFPVTKYLRDLPSVTVKGETRRFVNGVGYGIDGYCCEVGDRLKTESDKKVNYTAIAIEGLLFHYKPKNAVITVDGVRHTYEKVWLAPTMLGRYYGGGMMPTPDQKRDGREHLLSVMVFHGSGKLKTLAVFPSIFKGEHVKHTDAFEILTGHEITVEYDSPTPLQIDGETVTDVLSYTARYARTPARSAIR